MLLSMRITTLFCDFWTFILISIVIGHLSLKLYLDGHD